MFYYIHSTFTPRAGPCKNSLIKRGNVMKRFYVSLKDPRIVVTFPSVKDLSWVLTLCQELGMKRDSLTFENYSDGPSMHFWIENEKPVEDDGNPPLAVYLAFDFAQTVHKEGLIVDHLATGDRDVLAADTWFTDTLDLPGVMPTGVGPEFILQMREKE